MWLQPERTGRAARRLLALAAVLYAVVGGIAVAWADAPAPSQGQEIASVASLFRRVHATFPGRILTVELEFSDPPAYEVKLLTASGNVLKLSYDAVTLRLESVVGHRDREDREASGADGRDDEQDKDRDKDDDHGRDNSGPGGGGDDDGHEGGDDD